MKLSFAKMHGLGNDFVVVDARDQLFSLSEKQIQALSNRKTGIGFDQLLVLELTQGSQADFMFRVFNADGSEVGQCGNGARCMGLFIQMLGLSHQQQWLLQTTESILRVQAGEEGEFLVEMPVPQFVGDDIPSAASDKLLPFTLLGKHYELGVVNLGNPHAVIRVDHIDPDELVVVGEFLSGHQWFPAGVNVSFMRVVNDKEIELSVYERGVGLTQACGSGACAAMVVGRMRGYLSDSVEVVQPGGCLTISWLGAGSFVWMRGAASFVFNGTLDVLDRCAREPIG